jgi:hypothetical protein
MLNDEQKAEARIGRKLGAAGGGSPMKIKEQ